VKEEWLVTKRLCIIPCGRTKIWDKHPEAGSTAAQDVYIGTFSKSCQAYARLFFDEWVVLSAKHGFLRPLDVLEENYDVSFTSDRERVITKERMQKQLMEKGLVGYDEVVVLGGKKYARAVQGVFSETVKLKFPLSGYRGIGYMVQALQEAVRQNQEFEKKEQ
jgi:hypothetical protein